MIRQSSYDGVAQMPERRRVEQTEQLEDRLAQEAKQLREEARKLGPGGGDIARQDGLRRVRASAAWNSSSCPFD